MGRPTILDRRFEDAPEAVKPDIIGGGYTTLSPRTSHDMWVILWVIRLAFGRGSWAGKVLPDALVSDGDEVGVGRRWVVGGGGSSVVR
jgi:hypothetical protein